MGTSRNDVKASDIECERITDPEFPPGCKDSCELEKKDGSDEGQINSQLTCDEAEARKALRTLMIMFASNTILTVAQLTCGAYSHSLSLMGDGILMAIDSVSYCVSIYVERQKSSAAHRARLDRIGGGISAVMLAATTAWLLFDALDRLIGDEGEENSLKGAATQQPLVVPVDSLTMVVFTAVNLVVDAIVVAFIRLTGLSEGEENLNLWSAFAHLFADVIRGIAVMIAGILSLAGVVDAAKADAYCSLFVCVFVLAGAVQLFRTLLHRTAPIAYDDFNDEVPITGGATSPIAADCDRATIADKSRTPNVIAAANYGQQSV